MARLYRGPVNSANVSGDVPEGRHRQLRAMRTWTREGRAHYPLEAALRRTHWLDERWADDAHDFAAMFIDALIEASNQQAPAKAIVTAYQRALRSVPIEPAEAQRLARLATVHAVREILAEAARNLTGSSKLCDELTRVATTLRDAMRELPSSKSRDDSALTSRASKASDELRRGAFALPADPAAAVFLGASRKQLALSIESLTTAAQASEQARVAVMATLNGVRGEARWVEAPVWVRRALVRDAVASAAASLGSSALDEGITNQSAIDAATALLTSINTSR